MALWSRGKPENKIGYLNQFTDRYNSVEILQALPRDSEVPDQWRELFASSGPDRITCFLRMWRDAIGDRLSNTLAYLKDHLHDIEVMRMQSDVLALYSIRNRLGIMRYYVGGNPARISNKLSAEWPQALRELQSLYDFQNGFTEFSSGAGLSQFSQVRSIEDLYAGPVDRPGINVSFNPTRAYLWFSNGAGGYVAIDLDNCIHDNAFLWWVDDQPTYDLNFWAVVDEWMVILFDN
jgi:hypothetical protein